MRHCTICNTDISNLGNRAIRCKECQKLYKTSLWNRLLGSARANKERYQFFKMLQDLTLVELQVIFGKTKRDCKYAVNRKELTEIRTRLKIVNNVYKMKKQILNDAKFGDEDYLQIEKEILGTC